jgi:hypothetical protein
MSDMLRNQPGIKIRIVLACGGLILLVLAGALLLLSPQSILFFSDSRSKALEITIAILGVLAAFGQWLFPFSPPKRASTDYQRIFRQQLKNDLNELLSKGTLVAFTTDHEVAWEISLLPHLLWHRSLPDRREQLSETRKQIVRRYRVGSGIVCAAVFRDLNPDDYMVWVDVNQAISVPVFPNEVAAVDLR